MTILPLQQGSDELTAFKIKFIRYGTLTEPARWSTVKIMARTSKEAVKAAQNRHRRATHFRVVK